MCDGGCGRPAVVEHYCLECLACLPADLSEEMWAREIALVGHRDDVALVVGYATARAAAARYLRGLPSAA